MSTPLIFDALHWARPWAALALLAPLISGWMRWRNRRDCAAYADTVLRRWAVRDDSSRWPSPASALLWLLLVAAAAGPRLPEPQQDASRAHPIDLVAVVGVDDTDSWQRSAEALRELLPRLRGERLGLVVYASSAGVLLPCTDDRAALVAALNRFDPEQLPATPSIGAAGALVLARQLLSTLNASNAALLWLQSAAKPPVPSPALRNQRAALQRKHLPVFTLILPRSPAAARSVGDANWTALYDHGIALLPATPQMSDPGWLDLSAWPLAGALLLWLCAQGLHRLRAWRWPLAAAVLLACWWLPGMAQAPGPAHAAEQAWQAWRDGHWDRARQLWSTLDGYAARIGEGDANYRLQRWAQAQSAFQRAVFDADTDHDRAVALYNLGNAAFHQIGGLRLALDAYAASLVLRPGDPAALRNAGLAQAQWNQDHPDAALVGIGKRGPEQSQDRYGDTSNLTPSAPDAELSPAAAVQDFQRLAPDGRMQGLGAALPSSGAAWLPAIDANAAWRKADLIEDHGAALQRALFDDDGRIALGLLQEGW